MNNTFSSVPRTLEAYFECHANKSICGEVFAGNYKSKDRKGMYYGIDKNGYPVLYINFDKNNNETVTIPTFVLGEGKFHVAFSIYDNRIEGYLNGRLEISKSFSQSLAGLNEYQFSVAGDDTSNNSYWFRQGNLYSLSFFSEPRSSEQILSDRNFIDLTDETLLAAFDFTKSKDDCSKNKNNICPYWNESENVSRENYAYTLAVVPDVQTLLKKYPGKVGSIFDYLLEKSDDYNIKRVLFLGDLTDGNTEEEWTLVRDEVARLDNVIPYSLVRGNHDGFIGTYDNPSADFNNFFGGESTYKDQYDGSFDGVNNTYKIDGNILFLNLDFGARDSVLEWASEIVSANGDKKIIVITHDFLFRNGEIGDTLCPPKCYGKTLNNPEQLWEKFISKHSNISMVINGHTASNDVVLKKLYGEKGNEILAVLSDFQEVDLFMGGDGIVNLLHFDSNDALVSIETYSTAKGKFYKHTNQIGFDKKCKSP